MDSDESNLVSIAGDGRGGAFAGGDSHGRILWARADGSVTTAYDAPEDEVRALALGSDGALYAAGLSSPAPNLDVGLLHQVHFDGRKLDQPLVAVRKGTDAARQGDQCFHLLVWGVAAHPTSAH